MSLSNVVSFQWTWSMLLLADSFNNVVFFLFCDHLVAFVCFYADFVGEGWWEELSSRPDQIFQSNMLMLQITRFGTWGNPELMFKMYFAILDPFFWRGHDMMYTRQWSNQYISDMYRYLLIVGLMHCKLLKLVLWKFLMRYECGISWGSGWMCPVSKKQLTWVFDDK